MIDRREFVTTGLLLATGSAVARPLLASSSTDTVIASPELFIYDSSFPQAQQLANSMASAGIALAAIKGDFTALWSTHLKPRWQQRPMTVAGLTTERTLFILQTLAADHRMKLLHSQQIEQVAGAEALHQWLLVPRDSAPKS
jgi:hypothetical protein